MIVRDQGDGWQVVAQPDHGDVCGAIAAAWGNDRFATPRRHESLVIAARRHDDGWAVWERTPDVDRRDGRPLNVFDIGIDVHIAFFRAMIAAVADEDPYAGLLASMHGAGLYTRRYGSQPEFKMTFEETAQETVDTFVAERNEAHERIAAELGIDPSEQWVDYKLLQVFDRLCLYLCLNDLVAGTEATLAPTPVDYDGEEVTLTLRPVAPWEVSVDPYPFSAPTVELTLPRRVMPYRSWESRAEFAAAYAATPIEQRRIVLHDPSAL